MSHSQDAMLTLSAVAKGQVAIAAVAFTVLSDPPPGKLFNSTSHKTQNLEARERIKRDLLT